MPASDHVLLLAADWAVVVALLVGAATAWRWNRATSVLVALTAMAWVAGGLFTPAVLWHRAVLVHLLLASPGWRPPSRPGAVTVLVTYVLCVGFPVVLFTEAANTAHAVAVVLTAAYHLRGSTGRTRHHRRTALVAAVVLASVVVAGGVLRSLGGDDLRALALLVYEAGVVATALLVVAGQRPPVASMLTDLVIDIGESRSGTMRDALARTLRDPDLRLGLWDPAAGAFVDESGRVLDDRADPRRAALRIGPDGRPLALLQVDPGLAGDPEVVSSIRAAARVIALNARRHQELVDQAHELEASRQRLLEVADEEQRRLADRLQRGVVRGLERLAADLRRLDTEVASGHVDRALGHLEGTIEDLEEVAAGLAPRELAGGLVEALTALAERAPGVARIEADPADLIGLPGEVELAAWYVCAEALSNTAKHAPGARSLIECRRTDHVLHVRVSDDGRGGAALVGGGGLAGLRDRVDAVDGHLHLCSDGSGTVLEAELPLDRGTP